MNLTDEQWRLIEPILPPSSPSDRGRPPLDRRAVLDGILWKFRTGNPWYDMPPDYPSYQTCYRYHRRWARDGVMKKITPSCLPTSELAAASTSCKPSRMAVSVLTKLVPSREIQLHQNFAITGNGQPLFFVSNW